MNAAADSDPECLRVSMDTKATICLGEYMKAVVLKKDEQKKTGAAIDTD